MFFDKKFDFGSKFPFLVKLLFGKIFDFGSTFPFLVKIMIFDKDFDFW